MDLLRRSVALYGRFSPGSRDVLRGEIEARGGIVARDLTRRSDVLVIGQLATTLIDGGALASRIASGHARKVPVFAERRFAGELADAPREPPPSLPLATALGPSGLTRADADILAAFDLIVVADDYCRFADAATIRTAGELKSQGRTLAEIVRILGRAREHAPAGRHKIVLTDEGIAALQWDDGVTTLEGQGMLPLDAPHAGIDELFEAAELAEIGGDFDEAARLYEMCATADRRDAIAPYNLGNIYLAQERHEDAAGAYQRALARDPDFIEAHYNSALALEAMGKARQAAAELIAVLDLEPQYQDAVFNLAQLFLNMGDMPTAKSLFERYLSLNPPPEWASTARKAIHYCTAKMTG